MQKELVIVIIIFIIIIVLNIVSQNYTKKAVETINPKLEEVSKIAQEKIEHNDSDNSVNLNEYIENIVSEWKTFNKVLAYYIEHDELEKVDTSMVELKENILLESYEDAIPEIQKCIFILNHIDEKGSLKVINFF